MKAGLRIDVDTWNGTRFGVPYLLSILAEYQIKATFFMSVGPDNMGRHLWRLLRPAFFLKMLHSRATSLYGWSTLLQGTCWPGRIIGKNNAEIIRKAANRGHEIGLHAWDHYTWQQHLDEMSQERINTELSKAYDSLNTILEKPPACSAVPAWRCHNGVLIEKEFFPFQYNSDCRGKSLFIPEVGEAPLSQPQIPVTLPTYDEIIGRNGITDINYNEYILDQIRPDQLNVYTIHAEVEGFSRMPLFHQFLHAADERGIEFVPLSHLLKRNEALPSSKLSCGSIPGREGWGAVQANV